MNIKPMLVRLESAMAQSNLVEEMVLLPESPLSAAKRSKLAKSVSLVVGYNGSPSSQTALDLTMWIVHQTRLATPKQVTVQVVYVVDPNHNNSLDRPDVAEANRSTIYTLPSEFQKASASNKTATSVLTKAKSQTLVVAQEKAPLKTRHCRDKHRQPNLFEQADRILWQARCLAEEWRGSFKAHLRFGDVTTEIRRVVEEEPKSNSCGDSGCVVRESVPVYRIYQDL